MVGRSGRQLLASWRDEFKPRAWLPAVTAGLLLGITEVIVALSLGSLIFSGPLAPYLARGLGLALFSAAVSTLALAVTSRVPGVIGSAQDSPSAILAVIAAGVAGTLGGATPDERFATVVVAIGACSLLTGVFLLALGQFRLGGLVRYLPYPVVGGFLAGTGWLLARASFSVTTGVPLSVANLPALLQPHQLVAWTPAALLAVALFAGLRRSKHVLAFPGILAGGVALFYLGLLLTGTSIAQATQAGLLLGTVSGDVAWRPLTLPGGLAANWAAIVQQGGNIAIAMALSAVALLLNVSGLELALGKEVDLNWELCAAGTTNILSGLGGGLIGYHALSLSALSYRTGARGRLPGLIAGAVCIALLLSGPTLLAYFPKPILGGLLLFLGVDFLYDWLVAGWTRLARADYAVVVLILVVIAATDFLVGVGVGLIAMIALFALSYSRIDVVYRALSGAGRQSSVQRCGYHGRVLRELGRKTYILELRGFLFFGTANALLDRIRTRLADAHQPPAKYIVLDFCRVSGLDSSAGASFARARQLAEAQDVVLVLTQTSDRIRRQLALAGLAAQEKAVAFFPDLDHGLEWCEEQLLALDQVTMLRTPVTLAAQLADSGFDKAQAARLKPYLERVKFDPGDYLIRQGDEADRLYFVELGCVSVWLETASGERVRLQTFELGTAVGDLDLYQGMQCTAAVVADTPVTAFRLTRAALSEMKRREPELAIAFQEYVAHVLAERLGATARTLEAVLQ